MKAQLCNGMLVTMEYIVEEQGGCLGRSVDGGCTMVAEQTQHLAFCFSANSDVAYSLILRHILLIRRP